MVELMEKFADGRISSLTAAKARWNEIKASHGCRTAAKPTAKSKSKSKPKAKAKSAATNVAPSSGSDDSSDSD